MLKVGDKLICKHHNGVDDFDFQFLYHIKGKEYKILEIDELMVLVTSEISDYWLSRVTLFEYYFYTESELRKLKLKKLNNV